MSFSGNWNLMTFNVTLWYMTSSHLMTNDDIECYLMSSHVTLWPLNKFHEGKWILQVSNFFMTHSLPHSQTIAIFRGVFTPKNVFCQWDDVFYYISSKMYKRMSSILICTFQHGCFVEVWFHFRFDNPTFYKIPDLKRKYFHDTYYHGLLSNYKRRYIFICYICTYFWTYILVDCNLRNSFLGFKFSSIYFPFLRWV